MTLISYHPYKKSQLQCNSQINCNGKVVQPFCIRQKENHHRPSASAKTDSALHNKLAYQPGRSFGKFDTTARSQSRQSSVGLLSKARLQTVVANHGFDASPTVPAFFHLVLTTVVVKSLLRKFPHSAPAYRLPMQHQRQAL